jgi:hypothetical protein
MKAGNVETGDARHHKGGKLPPGVYWRHQTLWIAYYVTGPDGRRQKHREPTEAKSPREAGQLRAAHMTEHARGERTIEARKLTVDDVVAAVLTDYETNGRSSLDTAKGRAKAIVAALGATTLATDVTTDAVQRMQRDWLRARVTAATVNRRCNLLRRGLRLLLRARRLPFVPYIPRLVEEKRRGRYITATDREAIRTHLPAYARDVFSLALLLPNRRGQLSRTLRRYVDLDRGVIEWPAAECKADESHTVPLEGEALAVVERAMGAAVPHCAYLFHGPDCAPGRRPSKRYGCVGDFKKAWASACKAAGLPVGRKAGGYVFHHSRNTAATDLRAAGLSEGDCMALGGWKSRAVFDWYNLGDVEALRDRLAAAREQRGKVVALRKRQGGAA